jgi:hypothetical protein
MKNAITFDEERGCYVMECGNERLTIDALPELLHELAHLVRLLETPINDGRVSVPGLATLNAAKAAISKALGDKDQKPA